VRRVWRCQSGNQNP